MRKLMLIGASLVLLSTAAQAAKEFYVPPPVPMPDRSNDPNWRISQDMINHGAMPMNAAIHGDKATMQVGTIERPCTITMTFNHAALKQANGKVLPVGWNTDSYTCTEGVTK